MSQSGYTPILIYSSSTASNAPAAGNLTNSTLGSELAINITDGKLFYKDNANVVQVIGWKTVPTTAGGTGLTSYAAGDLIYYASGTALTKLGIGTAYQALQVNAGGTAPSWQPSATSVLTTQGDLLYASAANTLARLAKNTTATRYLANTGTNNNPDWAQINLANGVTGTLPTTNGGTGLTSFTANGVVYASSTSALATASALTFDGTNFATTGTATATKFIPTGGAATGNGMYLPAANTLAFSTNGAEAARIDSGKNLMVATTSSGGTISCPRNGNNYNYYATNDANNTTEGFFLGYSSGAGANRIIIYSNGNVVNANNSYGLLSDIKLKENIVDATPKLDKLMQVRVVNYNLKTDPQLKQIGVIAQELEQVFPSLVDEHLDKDSEGNDLGTTTKSVKMSVFVPILIKAIQELQQRIVALENKG